MTLRLTTLIVFGLLMGGCTFSAPQFEAGIRFIERVASGNSETAEELRATWLASVGDRGAVLLPFIPDWRWGMYSERTHWYPSMRLIRQEVNGDWSNVFKAVRQEIERLVFQHGRLTKTGTSA